MARTLKSDKMLFWAALLLVCTSVVMVYSASAVQADTVNLASYHLLVRQLVWALLGLGLLLVVMRIDYHQLRRPAVIWALLAVTVVALLAVFLSTPRKNTYRWITVGSLSWQPSELAKVVAVLFAAALLERRMHRINDVTYALVPIGVVTVSLAGLIVVQPDFGTATVLTLVVTAMVFAAGLSYRYLFGTALVLLPTAMMLILGSPYRRRRLMAFLDPWEQQFDAGFQVVQSLVAVGSGGLLGRGLMAGVQKIFYIPEPHNDFIFAVIGEELGLVGTTLTLLCFGVIAWRGLRTALVAPDRFGSLLALGLTLIVALQALLNMSVVVGLLPTKGIPLPLVSNGGSSLVVTLAAMGVLLNISQQSSPTAAVAIEGRE
jgi:cell division protein FtsW